MESFYFEVMILIFRTIALSQEFEELSKFAFLSVIQKRIYGITIYIYK